MAKPCVVRSVDGMHSADLGFIKKAVPGGAFAKLAGMGITYSHAYTQVPTDSFPGLLSLVTGASPCDAKACASCRNRCHLMMCPHAGIAANRVVVATLERPFPP
jgi:Type I phosphodiesterase / nucleotide pyrophosphatase